MLCLQIVSGVALLSAERSTKDQQNSEVNKENAPFHGVPPEVDSTPVNTTLEVLKNALGVHYGLQVSECATNQDLKQNPYTILKSMPEKLFMVYLNGAEIRWTWHTISRCALIEWKCQKTV